MLFRVVQKVQNFYCSHALRILCCLQILCMFFLAHSYDRSPPENMYTKFDLPEEKTEKKALRRKQIHQEKGSFLLFVAIVLCCRESFPNSKCIHMGSVSPIRSVSLFQTLILLEWEWIGLWSLYEEVNNLSFSNFDIRVEFVLF